MYSNGPPRMAEQKQDDQLEHTYSSYVRIRDVALKTCQRWWTIGKSGERVWDIRASGTTWWWWWWWWWWLARSVSVALSTESESVFSSLPDIAWSSKVFQPKRNFSNHLITIFNWAVTFRTVNVFDCYYDLKADFELVKLKFQNRTTMHVHPWAF